MEYQVVELLPGQGEHEVSLEAAQIPSDRPVQIPGRNAVKRSQVSIQHHLLAAEEQDGLFDALGRNRGSRFRHGSLTALRISDCELNDLTTDFTDFTDYAHNHPSFNDLPDIPQPHEPARGGCTVGVLWVFIGCTLGNLRAPKTRVRVAHGGPTSNENHRGNVAFPCWRFAVTPTEIIRATRFPFLTFHCQPFLKR